MFGTVSLSLCKGFGSDRSRKGHWGKKKGVEQKRDLTKNEKRSHPFGGGRRKTETSSKKKMFQGGKKIEIRRTAGIFIRRRKGGHRTFRESSLI